MTLRHAGGYESRYLHLSAFGAGVRAGARVSQGQVIGRVGATGLVTGAHLHYELLRNGDPRQPGRRAEAQPAGRADRAPGIRPAFAARARRAGPALRQRRARRRRRRADQLSHRSTRRVRDTMTGRDGAASAARGRPEGDCMRFHRGVTTTLLTFTFAMASALPAVAQTKKVTIGGRPTPGQTIRLNIVQDADLTMKPAEAAPARRWGRCT